VLRLRAHQTPPPIIFISAAQDVRRLANELGLDRFLGKPFTLAQLTSLVIKALSGPC
jgi:DNA-binding response OmpR family regulator